MYKPIYIFIGLRCLWNSNLTNFKKIITILSILGISFGVTSIIIIMSLSNGFENEFKKNILSFIPHLILTNKNHYVNKIDFPVNILTFKNIKKISSFISSKVLVQNKKKITTGEIISLNRKNDNLFKNYNIKDILNTLNYKENNVIIGKKLSEKLNIKINDVIKLIVFPNNEKKILTKQFYLKKFKVTGLFYTKNNIDNYQILMNTKIALNFLKYNKNYVTGWRIWLKNPFSLDENLYKKLKNNLFFLDWKSKEGELFKAIQIEKYIMLLFLILILVIVGFNIIITLTVNMIEKQNIIAILQTQGLCRKKIILIFMTLGSGITIIGNLLGTLISLTLIFQKNILHSLINIFFNNINISIKIFPIQILLINIIIILLSILSTLYPIWNITQSTPSKILSNE